LVKKLPEPKNQKTLAVPFSLRIFRRCIEYGVSLDLARHLHFYDLQCLLIQFDIQKIEDYFKQEERSKLQSRGIKDVKDISGTDIKKFFGR
jgi:hypothetical protein